MTEGQNTRVMRTGLTRAYVSDCVNTARVKFRVPAIAVTVMNADAIHIQEIQGVRVFDRQDRATLDDYFHIGSCSKSVLAMMAAKLVEQGKIAWHTRFFDLFSELKAEANSDYYDITLEDLFLCRAGIKAYTDAATEPFPEYGPSVVDQRLVFMQHLVGLPPASKQRKGKFRHLYSNASYTMAAAMLECVSDSTYEELVTKTLTDDLGLSVHIGWPNGIDTEQPWGHMIHKSSVESYAPDHDYRLPDLIAPAGDLSMTPKDYAKYTQMHLRGLRGSDGYLTGASFHRIHFGQQGFSLGVANGSMAGKRFSGFDGSAGTFFCRSIIVPDSDFAFTIMMNAGSGTASMKAVDWLTMRIAKKNYHWWWMFWV